MLFIRSLLCIRGYDNGRRFLLVSLACYALVLMFSSILLKAPLLLVLLLLICVPVLSASSIRRIHDAAFATPLAIVPVVVFILTLFGIIYIEHGAKYLLLVLASLVTVAMTIVSNARVRRQHHYQLGYAGPVNEESEPLHLANRQYFNRIEPTIAGNKNESTNELKNDLTNGLENDLFAESNAVTHAYIEDSLAAASQSSKSSVNHRSISQNPTWEETLRKWLLVKRNATLVAASIILVCIVAVLLWSFTAPDSADDVAAVQQVETAVVKQRNNKLEMPDNFWVMTDQYNALTIAWQGTVRDDGEVWSPVTALGDNDCMAIRFNNAESYRTMKVETKNQGDYYADFSPVDSKAIIQAIALQSRFNLCGIEFSLKGTQALLMSNRVYSDYLTQP